VYLSTKASGLVQSELIPVLGEEGVHEIFRKVLGEHRELSNIQVHVGGPLEVFLGEPTKVAFADRLL
jgi:hypothetical protein